MESVCFGFMTSVGLYIRLQKKRRERRFTGTMKSSYNIRALHIYMMSDDGINYIRGNFGES